MQVATDASPEEKLQCTAPVGLFWDSSTDSDNPKNWPFRTRIPIAAVITSISFLSSLASAIAVPGTPDIEGQFNVKSKLIGTLPTSLYVLGLGVGPFVLAPLSELYGRKPIYCCTLVLFAILQIGCACSSSITTLTILRFLAGCFGSVAPSLGAASMSDLWGPHERGIWNSFLSIGVLTGPPVGTVIASFIVAGTDWRWIFWVTAIVSGILLAITFLVFKETYEPVILERRYRLRHATSLKPTKRHPRGILQVFSRALTRPIRFLVFNPVVLVVSVFAAYFFSIYYLILVSLPLLFGTSALPPSSTSISDTSSLFTYSFSPISKGLAYLGLAVGSLIGGIFQMNAQTQIYRRLTKKHGGNGRPEYRILPMMVSAWMFPIGLLWYGWSAEARIAWIMPEVGLAVFAFGVFVTFQSVQIYLAEAFIPYGASAIAAATLLRSLAGFAFPLFGKAMFLHFGYGWASTVLATVALGAVPIPWVLYVWGGRLRERFRMELE